MTHFDAVRALFDGFPFEVHLDGEVPAPPHWPYAVLFMDTGNGERTKLCSTTDATERNFQVTSVGLSRQAVEAVSEAVMVAVLDQRPVVDGWVCNPIEHVYSSPVFPDDNMTDPKTNMQPKVGIDRFRYRAVKA